MAAARIAIVLGEVALKPDEDVAVVVDLDRQPSGPDVAIVIVAAGREVLAEAVARQARDRAADADAAVAAHRRAGGKDQVGLLVGADGAAYAQFGVRRHPARHIFDRAADRVAAVERALWAAQNLDPLDL